MGQIPRKVRSKVSPTIFSKAPRHEDLGVTVAEREFHVGIGLIVAQQDVEARLALLDQVVFKRQRLMLIRDGDVFQIHRLAHQRAGLGMRLVRRKKVRPDPRTQVLGLADVDYSPFGVLIQIAAGAGGQRANFLEQIHCGRTAAGGWPGYQVRRFPRLGDAGRNGERDEANTPHLPRHRRRPRSLPDVRSPAIAQPAIA